MVNPKALDIGIDCNLGKVSVRGYLKQLLITLWREDEDFDAKKPFGNSGWQYTVYAALIKGKFIHGSLDKDGFVEEIDSVRADMYIMELIGKHL